MDQAAMEVVELIQKSLDAKPIRRKRFLDAWRATAGWTGSYRQATRRMSQWLNAEDHHQLPVAALPDLIRAIGDARFLDPLLALELRVQREERIGPRKVAPRERERRESA